ncbi:MAG: alpha/beta hydrolase family protein [Thermoguttaceae bacterium]
MADWSVKMLSFLLLAGTVTSVPVAKGEPPQSGYPIVAEVTKTFDGKPFSYRIESAAEKSGYRMYRITYPSPVVTAVVQNNTVPAEYYVPSGVGPNDPKRPAVICMHILDGNMELVRMTATVLASHGVPAILFKLPYYGERGLPGGPQAMARNPRMFVSAVSQAMQDVRRTVDVLSARSEIDPGHIGIVGISLGGIVAATAAEYEPRLSRAMLVLAGGDVMAIIRHARETRELNTLIAGLPTDQKAAVEKIIAEVDPLHFADRLRDRARLGKVLMVNAGEDEVIPRACTERLAAALGLGGRVQWLDGLGHYTAMAELPQVLEEMAAFFAQDLPPGTKLAAPPAGRNPVQVLLAIAQEGIGMLRTEPAAGHCHLADVEIAATPRGAQPITGRVRLIRGTEGKFHLECRAPVIGEVAIGQGAYPWMRSTEKVLFQGTKNAPAKPGDPFAFVDPWYLARLRMVSGALAGAALAPDVLESLAGICEVPPFNGHPAIRVTLQGRSAGTFLVLLKEDRKSPHGLTFDLPGVKGTLKFHAWETNTVAHDTMFAPPPGLTEKAVEPVELQRIFSAMFNFAMENLQ